MNPNINIEGKRIILRDLSLKDANDFSKIRTSTYTQGRIDTFARAKSYISKSLKSKDEFELAIVLKETGELIGGIELCHLSWWIKGGEIALHLKKEFRKKGYGTEAARLLINYCFKKMGLRKLYADHDPNNQGSRNLLKKLGFKLEGISRERNLVNGTWIDEWNYGLLKREWKG